MEGVLLIIGMKYIAIEAEGDCYQHESTKAKVPEGARNQNNLIGDPLVAALVLFSCCWPQQGQPLCPIFKGTGIGRHTTNRHLTCTATHLGTN